ncbi:carboxypeptidase SOL1 isoform X2 [Populus trichocarpa]|uniref:carboxypeptidase SOL1 isoform X2 n=1 Tax=Populus trichocarpa TaxID=3694 RepID=UPI0022787F7A|nr:carboxypeptidase SOL1 isoform X2 [Populus trichocarpa]
MAPRTTREITMHALMMIHSGSWQAYIVSRSHHKMSLSEEFPGGITNEASWYPIYGGMQDWNYIHAGCFELTLEISDNKWPNASEVKAGRGFPDYHRPLAPGDRYEAVTVDDAEFARGARNRKCK